jgi:hypothetical protein
MHVMRACQPRAANSDDEARLQATPWCPSAGSRCSARCHSRRSIARWAPLRVQRGSPELTHRAQHPQVAKVDPA